MAIHIKNNYQIQQIRESCKIAKDALDFITEYVAVGITTLELNDLIEKFIKESGGIPAPLGYMGYPKATCISVNEVVCHGIPSTYTLKEGDILNIDVTVKLKGFFGDTSRMFAVGQCSDEALKLIEDTKECLFIGIKEVKPKAHFGNIGHSIANYAHKLGYGVVTKFGGHGVGLRFHEEPMIIHESIRHSGAVMKPGMIFTIEPMINQGSADVVIDETDKWTVTTVDKKLSAQWEHTVLVTDDGYEILT